MKSHANMMITKKYDAKPMLIPLSFYFSKIITMWNHIKCTIKTT